MLPLEHPSPCLNYKSTGGELDPCSLSKIKVSIIFREAVQFFCQQGGLTSYSTSYSQVRQVRQYSPPKFLNLVSIFYIDVYQDNIEKPLSHFLLAVVVSQVHSFAPQVKIFTKSVKQLTLVAEGFYSRMSGKKRQSPLSITSSERRQNNRQSLCVIKKAGKI